MMRPLPFAVCLALAATLPMAALTAPQQSATPVDAPAPAAEPATPAAPTGNAEAGRTLSYTCQGCHGVTGYKNAYPSYHVPRIGGQSS